MNDFLSKWAENASYKDLEALALALKATNGQGKLDFFVIILPFPGVVCDRLY